MHSGAFNTLWCLFCSCCSALVYLSFLFWVWICNWGSALPALGWDSNPCFVVYLFIFLFVCPGLCQVVERPVMALGGKLRLFLSSFFLFFFFFFCCDGADAWRGSMQCCMHNVWGSAHMEPVSGSLVVTAVIKLVYCHAVVLPVILLSATVLLLELCGFDSFFFVVQLGLAVWAGASLRGVGKILLRKGRKILRIRLSGCLPLVALGSGLKPLYVVGGYPVSTVHLRELHLL